MKPAKYDVFVWHGDDAKEPDGWHRVKHNVKAATAVRAIRKLEGEGYSRWCSIYAELLDDRV